MENAFGDIAYQIQIRPWRRVEMLLQLAVCLDPKRQKPAVRRLGYGFSS
jgi:hypothetical protein